MKKPQRDLDDLPCEWKSQDGFFSYITSRDLKAFDVPQRKDFFHGNGWRLTESGFIFLSSCFKSYCSTNKDNQDLRGRELANIGRIVQGPWYLARGGFFTWDGSLHFELSMFDGNLKNFVAFKVPK